MAIPNVPNDILYPNCHKPNIALTIFLDKLLWLYSFLCKYCCCVHEIPNKHGCQHIFSHVSVHNMNYILSRIQQRTQIVELKVLFREGIYILGFGEPSTFKTTGTEKIVSAHSIQKKLLLNCVTSQEIYLLVLSWKLFNFLI